MNPSAPASITVAALREFGPEVGLVLGSGLADFVAGLEVVGELGFQDAGCPESRVAGHAGRFVLAKLGGRPVLIAQGRVHLYEGWSAAEVTAGVRFMAEMGVRRLVLTNAAGCLNREFAPGRWMMISDHLNLTGTTPLLGGPHFHDMTAVYSPGWRGGWQAVARSAGLLLHEGVYAGLLGPQYETPAEIRMLGRLGADAVGMSTVLEAIQARAVGLEVSAFSCLTNWAAGLNAEPLSHAEVVETGRLSAAQLVTLFVTAAEQGILHPTDGVPQQDPRRTGNFG